MESLFETVQKRKEIYVSYKPHQYPHFIKQSSNIITVYNIHLHNFFKLIKKTHGLQRRLDR